MSSEYLFAHKNVLGLEQFSVTDIEHILNTAESFKEISVSSGAKSGPQEAMKCMPSLASIWAIRDSAAIS